MYNHQYVHLIICVLINETGLIQLVIHQKHWPTSKIPFFSTLEFFFLLFVVLRSEAAVQFEKQLVFKVS